jgi:hypothetical protein
VGDNRNIYSNNCGNTYKYLKLRERRVWKMLASSQTNNKIQKQKCREKSKILMFYNIHSLPVPSVTKNVTTELNHMKRVSDHPDLPCKLLTTLLIRGIRMGEISTLGCQIRFVKHAIWEDSLYFF